MCSFQQERKTVATYGLYFVKGYKQVRVSNYSFVSNYHSFFKLRNSQD